MRHRRASGILLHPTSLPGPFGIGDLGPSAARFVEFLSETGQRWWQLLPLGPTGWGNSPYQSHSSFAGNPLLISPERLVDMGLLAADELASARIPSGDQARFAEAEKLKDRLLRKAFARFENAPSRGFDEFLAREREWLDDFAFYFALKHDHQLRPWYEWEPELALRNPEALDRARRDYASEIRFQQFVQWIFACQWEALRETCRRAEIALIGDLPIYVAEDSADVWRRHDLFELDEAGRPTVVAGVPPDNFNPESGQRWGNPLYRWEAHRAEDYAWWAARLSATLKHVDLVRLDHFRGFAGYWEIPSWSKTAANGRWVTGPGAEYLEAMRRRLGGLPLIAEDLGVITPDVEAIRDGFNLPGMRILQFAFSGREGEDGFLPHRHIPHCIVYTGTHDNDTTIGWYDTPPGAMGLTEEQLRRERAFFRDYVGPTEEPVQWALARLAFASVADTAIIPMQDVLGLDTSARMNFPGDEEGRWWGWRFDWEQLTDSMKSRLTSLTSVYARWSGVRPNPLGA